MLLCSVALTACGSSPSGAVSAGNASAGNDTVRSTATGSAPGATTSGSTSRTGPHRVDTGLDYLHVAVGISGGADSVLTTPQEARMYPGWFDRSGDHEVAAQLRARLDRSGVLHPEPGQALVAVTATVGCGQPRGARLRAEGADLTVEWTGATPVPPECLAPYRAVVVFRVPASALPEHPTVNGEQPDPAGP